MPGYAIRKVDTDHAAILDVARGVGATVIDTHTLGRGVPDAVVIFHGLGYLIEIKSKGRGLNAAEKRFAQECRIPVWIVRSADELLEVIGAVAYRVPKKNPYLLDDAQSRQFIKDMKAVGTEK